MPAVRGLVAGQRKYLLIGLGVVLVAVSAFVFWRGPSTTIEIEFTGPPGLNYRVDCTVDGDPVTFSGPLPDKVTIRGRDIHVRIGKEGQGELGFRTTTDGHTGRYETLRTPGGSTRYHLPARRFWLGRGETRATSRD